MTVISRKTALFQRHIDAGAKMVPFAGYEMPIKYEGIVEEHMCVREHVGLFDVSHMGEFIVKGEQALDLVQAISSNDVSKLTPGDAQYSYIPNLSGGIVDDMIVYRLFEDRCADNEQAFMLVVNASNRQKDMEWILEHNSYKATVEDISDRCGLIAIQGPKASAVLQKLTSVNLADIEFYHFAKGEVAGVKNVIISATGYTGSGGFELYADETELPILWDAVMEAGKDAQIMPCGLGARDTLRLEMGYCLYGNDIDESTNPFEAGLNWITKLAKDPFVAKESLTDLKAQKKRHRLVGFIVNDRRVPRNHYEIQNDTGQRIGYVTSGTQSPCLDAPIGMGYVDVDYAKTGSTININTGRKIITAEIIKLPFYKKS